MVVFIYDKKNPYDKFRVNGKCRRDFLLYYRNHSVTGRTELPYDFS